MLAASCATTPSEREHPEPRVLWSFEHGNKVLVAEGSIYVRRPREVRKYELGEDGSLIGPIWTKTDFSPPKDCMLPGRRSPVTNGTFGSLAANQAHFTDSGLLILPVPCQSELLVDAVTGQTVSKRRFSLYKLAPKHVVVERGNLEFWRGEDGTFAVKAPKNTVVARDAYFCRDRVFVARDRSIQELDLDARLVRTLGEPVKPRYSQGSWWQVIGLYRGDPVHLGSSGYHTSRGFEPYFREDLVEPYAILDSGIVFGHPFGRGKTLGTNLMPGFERCCSYDVLISGHDPQCKL